MDYQTIGTGGGNAYIIHNNKTYEIEIIDGKRAVKKENEVVFVEEWDDVFGSDNSVSP